MKPDCTFVLDQAPSAPRSLLDEHAAVCGPCARSLALRASARRVWALAKTRDDERDARIRVRRLALRMKEGREVRGTFPQPALALVVFAGLFAATAAAMVGEARRTLAHDEVARVPVVRVARGLAEPRRTVSMSVAGASAPPAPPVEARPETPRGARADEGEVLWQASEAALARGDRAAAETSLRLLLGAPRKRSLMTRAELRLAELLLARRALLEARSRLLPLVLGRDQASARDASDATWLYARTYEDARDRAAAWGRIVATEPLGPMRDLAAVEEAKALHEAGDDARARAIADALEARGVAPVVRDALLAMRSRIGP